MGPLSLLSDLNLDDDGLRLRDKKESGTSYLLPPYPVNFQLPIEILFLLCVLVTQIPRSLSGNTDSDLSVRRISVSYPTLLKTD